MKKRSFKRGYKKRRYRKRFFKKNKKVRYDGAVYVKCHQRAPLVVDIGGGTASMGIHWGASGVNSVNDYYISNNPEFTTYLPHYQQWKLNGLKIKYMPISEVTGALGSGILDLVIGSDTVSGVSSTAISYTAITKYADYREYKGFGNTVKRYYHAGKMFRKKNQTWRIGTSTSLATQYYDDATTVLRLASAGYANGNVQGYVDITWYVAFKGWDN